MKRVATFSITGPFAVQVRRLRHFEGRLSWHVKVFIERECGQQDIHVIEPAERVELGDLYPIVKQSIDELCAHDGTRLTAARMEFLIR